jgi:hypothetical protein
VTIRLRPRPRAGRAILLALAAFAPVPMQPGRAPPALAAELDGVTLPDSRVVDGTTLRLNGMGVRTFSMFHIRIYVAGLYLPEPSSDAAAILRSDETKLLDIRFVHDVTADRSREAWMTGFRDNCRPPCRLPANMLDEFLRREPDLRAGDRSTLLFRGQTVEFRVNGQSMGTVTDPEFTRVILATFIGAYPPTEPLKRGLLGLAN